MLERNGRGCWTGNSQKGTVGMCFRQEDMPFSPITGMTPDIVINPHCLVGDTLVSLGHGISRRIDKLSPEGGEVVLSWNGIGFNESVQMGLEPKGVRDIVKITLEDGHTLKCTPDHKILTVKSVGIYEWVEAEKLRTMGKVEDGKWVVNNEVPNTLLLGPEFPEDIIGSDEDDWKFEFFDGSSLSMRREREQCLALARLIGLILSDGCISHVKNRNSYVSNVCLGHQIDVNACLRDIMLLTGKIPKLQSDDLCYSIRIPCKLTKRIALLPNMTIGRKSRQEEKWPQFLLETDCPISILREFLGGLFGGNGHAPYFLDHNAKNLKSKRGDRFSIEEMRFSQSAMPKYEASMILKMNQLAEMLSKFDIQTKLRKRENTIDNEQDENTGTFSYELSFLKSSTIFYRRIGFRYCVQKMCRLFAMNSYWSYIENIKRQHDFVIRETDLLYKFGDLEPILNSARTNLLSVEPPLNQYYSLSDIQDVNNRRRKGRSKTLEKLDYKFIKNAEQYFEERGCLHWFWIEGVTGEHRTYIVTHDMNYVPYLPINVLETRYMGQEEVFDISVSQTESFLASGIAVHNCVPSRMTCGQLIEALKSKVNTFLLSSEPEKEWMTDCTPFRDSKVPELETCCVV